MALDPDIRIKIRQFFVKNKRILIFIIAVLVIAIIINRLMTLNKGLKAPETSYTPHTAVLDTPSSEKEPPKEVAKGFEAFIKQYVDYCNEEDYVNAYNLVSEDCIQNFFGSSYDNFVEYVKAKFGLGKKYAIQNYSNYNGKYIYTVKIFDDFLATGLTNESYRYVEEKMIASYDEKGNVVFSVGNFIQSKELAFQASNDYLKAEITKSVEKYSFIIYNLKVTNRSNYTVVIKDGYADKEEVLLEIGYEARPCSDSDINIVLHPGESKNVLIPFSKFYDSKETPQSIILNAVRVMENYTGEPEMVESEIENAIDKFSMNISLK